MLVIAELAMARPLSHVYMYVNGVWHWQEKESREKKMKKSMRLEEKISNNPEGLSLKQQDSHDPNEYGLLD